VSVDGHTRAMPLVPPAAAGGKKGKKVKGGRRAGDKTVSIAHHPRVAARVRAAKGWGALIAFGLVAMASAKAGAPTYDVLLRALIAGFAGWVVTWVAAVQIGQAVVRAEVEAHVKAIEAEHADDEDGAEPTA
jgi:multisubunit Na+/H+ antiporter MnhG subunit